MFFISYLLGMWIGFIFKTESPIFPIDDRIYRIIMVYLGGFFGNRVLKVGEERILRIYLIIHII